MRITIIGPVSPPISGPGVKNKIIIKELKRKCIKIKVINTLNWKKNFFTILFKIIFDGNKRIFLSTSKKGRFIFSPFLLLKKILSKDFKYVILPMGGRLYSEVLELNILFKKIFIKSLEMADYVFVESIKMEKNISKEFNISNIEYLTNFKEYNKISYKDNLKRYNYNSNNNSYKIIFMSRVRKKKGIEIALEGIKKANKILNNKIIFDIYGPFAPGYVKDFNKILIKYPFARYKGIIAYNKVSKIISNYDIFTFPTFYEGEGFPAILIDALMAGVPIIASNWANNSEIIKDGINGFLFESKNEKDLSKKIIKLISNEKLCKQIKKQNLIEAKKYDSRKVINDLILYLQKKGW